MSGKSPGGSWIGSRPSGTTGGVFACVVESRPRFDLELLRWFACLTNLAGVEPSDLVIGVAGSSGSRTVEYLRRSGVNVCSFEPFDPRSPHCNKIAVALALSEALAAFDCTVVLTDADVVVLEDARLLPLAESGLALKPVDAPYPPLEVLRPIYDAAGLPYPPLAPLYHVPTEESFVTNANGGVYIVKARVLRRLSYEWASWALWLLERRQMLKNWQVHVDQVAMGLALAAIRCQPQVLDVTWNFPIHVPTWNRADAPVPAIIHYHDWVLGNGLLRRVGVPAVDESINRSNSALRTFARGSFSARAAWYRCVLRCRVERRAKGLSLVPRKASA